MANVISWIVSEKCYGIVDQIFKPCFRQSSSVLNITCHLSYHFDDFCLQIRGFEEESNTETKYGKPMVLIGMYISIASLFCILAMALDLLYGFRNRKFWFPTKFFSLNAASITVIAVAMKLPVDLTSPMPTSVEKVSKLGGLAFLCTMISNLMPSLASMDNKSLLANVTGLSILVITIIVNIFIQIRTHVIITDANMFLHPSVTKKISYMYMGMLLFLQIILISSAITLPTSKKVLELKYQATSKTILNDQTPQQNEIEKLRQVMKRYWIMAETGNPQFVMASNILSSASGISCAISMLIYIYLVYKLVNPNFKLKYIEVYKIFEHRSVYKWAIAPIFITQFIGIVVGSIAPIFRCFTLLSFISFANQNRNHFMVFEVEKSWTQKLYEWKESRISFLSSGRRSRVLHNLKNLILSFFIGFQKVIVVSCRIIGLFPIVVIIFVVCCSHYFKLLKAMLLTPPTTTSSDYRNEDLSNYVLSLEDNTRLAEKTMKRISDSMNRLIENAGKKQNNNLLKLLEKSVAFDGIETFDVDQVQSLLPFEHVNSWSLPVISLTCIAICIPNIHKDDVVNLFRSVGEGLLYTHLVEESLNTESVYVNIRKATVTLWHEVEDNYKWMETTLKRSAYEGKKATYIVKQFASIAEKIVNECMRSTGGEPVEKEKLPSKIIVANSMYRIANTIIHTYESNDSEITEKELFTRLSNMIADILSACLTNIPQVVEIRCHESVIEKREASVKAAVDLLGRTTQIIEMLETRGRPNIDADKMGFIDGWRLHLKHP
ncbi:hypothetical protein SSX86_032289 [Deinandra increscens subsp. villosa]|uniref:Uncharacterized protein n=1 Tax=Deinandra increscens subsp. villosa TaxID=3103831 RepID=A0AAP0C810_9ASTR